MVKALLSSALLSLLSSLSLISQLVNLGLLLTLLYELEHIFLKLC